MRLLDVDQRKKSSGRSSSQLSTIFVIWLKEAISDGGETVEDDAYFYVLHVIRTSNIARPLVVRVILVGRAKNSFTTLPYLVVHFPLLLVVLPRIFVDIVQNPPLQISLDVYYHVVRARDELAEKQSSMGTGSWPLPSWVPETHYGNTGWLSVTAGGGSEQKNATALVDT